MNIFLTFDYELFFGNYSGTLKKSIVEPTNELLSILSQYDAKATFYIDAGYIVKLKEVGAINKTVRNELLEIESNIKKLSESGHSVQLHIHPHWEDAKYINGSWKFDVKRFSLNHFSISDVKNIVAKYKATIENITGSPVFSYRAGGWCIQPFSYIASALKENGIWLDSTVFPGGYYNSGSHHFDFRNCPNKNIWHFNFDILLDSGKKGDFTELPISSYKVSPMFFWNLAIIRLLKLQRHQYRGDGEPIGAGKRDVFKMLTKSTYSVASVDGLKIRYLEPAFKNYINKSYDNFVVIGHPKAFSDYSFMKLNKFICKYHLTHQFISVEDKRFLDIVGRS